MPVIDAKQESEYTNLIGSGSAVVDFTASWCGPCRAIKPAFEELASTHDDIKFIRVDIEHAKVGMPSILSGISGVPTFQFYKDGKLVHKFTGANLNNLKNGLKKIKPKAQGDENPAEPDKVPEGEVVNISSGDQYRSLLSSGKVVVDFSAEWCMPCKMIAPLYEEMANSKKDLKFLRVDIDEVGDDLEDELADIRSVPTFLFYSNGELVDGLSGANPLILKQKVEKLSSLGTEKEESKKDPEPPAEDKDKESNKDKDIEPSTSKDADKEDKDEKMDEGEKEEKSDDKSKKDSDSDDEYFNVPDEPTKVEQKTESNEPEKQEEKTEDKKEEPAVEPKTDTPEEPVKQEAPVEVKSEKVQSEAEEKPTVEPKVAEEKIETDQKETPKEAETDTKPTETVSEKDNDSDVKDDARQTPVEDKKMEVEPQPEKPKEESDNKNEKTDANKIKEKSEEKHDEKSESQETEKPSRQSLPQTL